MDGDRPITTRDNDRLGFAPVAEHLARAIVDQSAKDGLVLGIEGKWGSGKSTLINLTIEALKKGGDSKPEIIEFSPWLVGDRDTLLLNLFDELAGAAVKIDPLQSVVDEETKKRQTIWQKVVRCFWKDEHWRLKQKERLKERLGGKLRAFGFVSLPVSKLTKAAGAAGVPGAELAGISMERGGEVINSLLKGGSVSKRKSELVAALKFLSRRIIVFVDDLDRLEPREASEVLRLIRAVADFPNVIYVLSYDPSVVAQTLKNAIGIDDGAAFLGKIVQVSFRVPRPEAFDLRRWFQMEVETLFTLDIETEENSPKLIRQKLAEAIDYHGGRYLHTARDVVRALNGLRLYAIPVRDRIYLPDMVWLQLVRIGNPRLHAWVEEYLTEVAAIANGATVTDAASEAAAHRLRALLTSDGVEVDSAWFALAQILPGLSRTGFDDGREKPRVFNNIGHSVGRFASEKRLGSPQHYRYYFAFSMPAGALSDDTVKAFVSTAESEPTNAIAIFEGLAGTERPQGGSMAEVLIDRLIASFATIPERAIIGIIAALADCMDDNRASKLDAFGRPRAWRLGERAVEVFLGRVTGETRGACLKRLFAEGKALGWLTSILRGEIFAHGHFGDRAESENQWLLSANEFASVLETMLDRYRNTPAEDLLRVPELVSLLYGWQQGSGTEEARRWVEVQTATDAGLLTFLSRARAWAATDDIVYCPLRRRDLENFLDYEVAVRRVQKIASDISVPSADRQLAAELMIAFDQGQDRDR